MERRNFLGLIPVVCATPFVHLNKNISDNFEGIRNSIRPNVLRRVGAEEITGGSFTIGSGGDYPRSQNLYAVLGDLQQDLTLTFLETTKEK